MVSKFKEETGEIQIEILEVKSICYTFSDF